MSNGPLDPGDRPGYGSPSPSDRPGYGSPSPSAGAYDAPTERAPYNYQPMGDVGSGQPMPAQRNGIGTAALVLGIIGLFLSLFVVGGVVGVIAVILGFIGLGRVKRREATNRRSAIAGITLGLIAATISLVIAFFVYSNRDDLSDLNACLENADTPAAEKICNDTFRDSITK